MTEPREFGGVSTSQGTAKPPAHSGENAAPESVRARIVKALEPYDIPTGGWTEAERLEPVIAVENALADWLDAINRRVEESEAYRRGKDDGYRYACELFGAELEAGRKARRELAEIGSSGGGADGR